MSISNVDSQHVIGASSNGMILSAAEFDSITEYDSDYCYELIHGVLVVNPIPSEAESDPNEELGFLLRQYRRTHPAGAAMDKTLAERYVRTRDSRRRADRVIWAGLGRRPDPQVDVPTIVVEFVSGRNRDRHRDYVEKRREYLEVGVLEYWIIDRFQRQMTVYRRGLERVVYENEAYGTDLLPGFEFRLRQLLAIADQWTDSSTD